MEAVRFDTTALFTCLNMCCVVLIEDQRMRKDRKEYSLSASLLGVSHIIGLNCSSTLLFLYVHSQMLIFAPLWKSICLTVLLFLWTCSLCFRWASHERLPCGHIPECRLPLLCAALYTMGNKCLLVSFILLFKNNSQIFSTDMQMILEGPIKNKTKPVTFWTFSNFPL